MKIIAIVAAVICILAMFKVKREVKVGLLFLGCMVFTLVQIPVVPFHAVNALLPIAFLASEWNNLSKYIKETRGKVVGKVASLAALMVVLVLINSPHLRDFDSIKGFVTGELFFKYFAILYAFWSCRDDISLRPLLKFSMIGIVVLTFFGVLNLISHNAYFLQSVYQGVKEVGLRSGAEMGEMFTDSDRFRVQSMFYNPFDYGYICLLTLLLHLYALNKKIEKQYIFYVVLVCSVFGIVTCACRTIFFCTVLCIGCYVLMAFKVGKTIRSFIFLCFISILSYNAIPAVQDKIDNTLTMFDKHSDVEGSSLDMRYLQYAAVLYHIKDSPLLGKGYHYFYEDLGWKDGYEGLRDIRLMGLEGVFMSYILERGFIGLAIYLILYISLFMYCIKIRNYDKHLSALGISVLVSYVLFANMTGELLSVYPTLLCIGSVVKIAETKKFTPPPI